MKTMLYRAEDVLARCWPWLFGGLLVLILCTSCMSSHIIKDPQTGQETLVTVGENALSGGEIVENVTGIPLEDVVGAAGDAVSNTDIGGVVADAEGGDWLSVVLALVGLGSATALGIKKRKKLREILARKKVS